MKTLRVCLIGLMSLLSLTAFAEQKTDLGEYELHYIVLNTTELSADVAGQYGITRSGKRAFINLSLLQKTDDGYGRPVSANITAVQRSLLGQQSDIPLEEIREGTAIYYIGNFRIFDQETLWFDLTVELPDGSTQAFSFSQKVWHE